MTFSILAHDEKTGVYAGAAATGSLCVGGWVLRGDIESGMVASQGSSPSPFWRDGGMRLLHGGATAPEAVAAVTGPDGGRAHRQLAMLDRAGRTAAFTGEASVAVAAHRTAHGLVVAGNMLTGEAVLDTLAARYLEGGDLAPADRLIAALRAAEAAGGDARGLLSAALLVLSPDAPPLDLRIDRSRTPLDDLAGLLRAARATPYADWLGEVPVLRDPSRAPGRVDAAE